MTENHDEGSAYEAEADADHERYKVKPKCDRADECESGPGCTASSIAECPYGYGEASE